MLRERHSTVAGEVVAELRELGAVVVEDNDTGLLTLDSEWNVSLVIARHRATGAGFSRWLIRFDAGLKPDITVAVRMAPGNTGSEPSASSVRTRMERRKRTMRPGCSSQSLTQMPKHSPMRPPRKPIARCISMISISCRGRIRFISACDG